MPSRTQDVHFAAETRHIRIGGESAHGTRGALIYSHAREEDE